MSKATGVLAAGDSDKDSGEQATGALRTRRLVAVVGTFLIAWLSWPIPYLTPGTGIDMSWRAALHMAAQRGMDFGTDIVYVYGPLGFLTASQLYYGATTAMAVLFVGSIHLALCFTILSALRRYLRLGIALALTLLAARVLLFIEPSESLELLVFLWAARLLTDEVSKRNQTLLLAGGAAISGVALMLKLNTGIVILAITFATVLALRSKPLSWAGFAGITLATFGVGWALSGQSFDNLAPYAKTSYDMISGHSRSLGVEESQRRWEHLGALVVILVLSLLGWSASRGIGWRKGILLSAVGGSFVFAAAKHGFVRHDAGHSVPFFAMMLLAPLGFGLLPRTAPGSLIRKLAPSFTAVLILVSAFWGATRSSPIPAPLEPAERALEQLRTMVSGEKRQLAMDQASQRMRNEYGLDEQTLAQIGDKTVHIDPWEAAVAWAYPELNWQPLPLFQSFTATSSDLDEMNVQALQSKNGPQMILRQPPRAVDYRNPFFEPPETNRAIFCNYAQVSASATWQLLERTEDRCGTPRLLGRGSIAPGQSITVPTETNPNEFVIVKITPLRESLLHRLRTQIYRSTATYVDLGPNGVYRLVIDNAKEGLVLKVPLTLGYSPPFSPPPSSQTMRVLSGQMVEGLPNREEIQPPKLTARPFDQFEFEFIAIPFSP